MQNLCIRWFGISTICTMCLLTVAARGTENASVDERSEFRLWYDEPAEKWVEALPLGNGRLGAMVFGGTARERLQLNEDTLWFGQPHDYAREGAHEYLQPLRQLLLEGKQREAERLAMEQFMSVPLRQAPYQPLADLWLTFPGHAAAQDYRRELDLDQAISRVRYVVDGIEYQRELLASYPDQVVAVRLTASQPRSITVNLGWTCPHEEVQVHPRGPWRLAPHRAGAHRTEELRSESDGAAALRGLA